MCCCSAVAERVPTGIWPAHKFQTDQYWLLTPILRPNKDSAIYLDCHFTFMWPCIVTDFFIIIPTGCTNFASLFLAWNSTCFGQCLCPSSGVHSLYTQQRYMSYRFVESFRAGSGCSILILLVCWLETFMTYTFAGCTVNELLTMDRGTVRNT